MKKIFPLCLVLLLAFAYTNCANSPTESAVQSELTALDTELAAVAFENPDSGTNESAAQATTRKARFRGAIKRLNRLLNRLGNYLENNPNEEAMALVEASSASLAESRTHLENDEKREAFEDARTALQSARQALKIIRDARKDDGS